MFSCQYHHTSTTGSLRARRKNHWTKKATKQARLPPVLVLPSTKEASSLEIAMILSRFTLVCTVYHDMRRFIHPQPCTIMQRSGRTLDSRFETLEHYHSCRHTHTISTTITILHYSVNFPLHQLLRMHKCWPAKGKVTAFETYNKQLAKKVVVAGQSLKTPNTSTSNAKTYKREYLSPSIKSRSSWSVCQYHPFKPGPVRSS